MCWLFSRKGNFRHQWLRRVQSTVHQAMSCWVFFGSPKLEHLGISSSVCAYEHVARARPLKYKIPRQFRLCSSLLCHRTSLLYFTYRSPKRYAENTCASRLKKLWVVDDMSCCLEDHLPSTYVLSKSFWNRLLFILWKEPYPFVSWLILVLTPWVWNTHAPSLFFLLLQFQFRFFCRKLSSAYTSVRCLFLKAAISLAMISRARNLLVFESWRRFLRESAGLKTTCASLLCLLNTKRVRAWAWGYKCFLKIQKYSFYQTVPRSFRIVQSKNWRSGSWWLCSSKIKLS